MTAAVRTLIGTHVLVFVGGVVVGKSLNADELELYRDAHEGFFGRLRRRGQAIGLGVLAVGTVAIILKVASSSVRNPGKK